ncbi:MAG: hypothetical protein NWE95_02415 [Candidatus Bathyarchaeota archaeon]|nr:hypothetical protein [Candidatus Bathyarchaeota archaeon]
MIKCKLVENCLTQTTYPMKKIVYTIISIGLIIAISVAVFALLFQANNSNVPKQNQLNIKITNFSINKGWSYVGGLVMDCSFNLTIENKGVENVSDLVLTVKMFHNNSEVQVGNYFFDGTYENGTITEPLYAGEVRAFKGTIMSIFGDAAYQYLGSNETAIIAFVTLDNVVLDQRKSE